MSRRTGLLPLLLAASLAACGGAPRSTPGPRPELTGAGATFPYPLYARWTSSYLERANVRINYLSVGSAEGTRLLAEGAVDFAGTDLPLSPAALTALGCGGALQLPSVAGAVAVAYRIPGVDTLITLDREALVAIFSGRVTRWNAPEITRLNPAFRFPSLPIRVVHRSEGSGTSAAFAAFLGASPRWPKPSEGQAHWPVGASEEGNEGVAARIRQTPGAIGYVEISYARQNFLRTARIRGDGPTAVAPSADGVRAALAVLDPAALESSTPLVNSRSDTAYPIVALSWFVVPRQHRDAAQRDRLAEFLHWTLHEGAAEAGALEYVPLPREVLVRYDSVVSRLTTGTCASAPTP